MLPLKNTTEVVQTLFKASTLSIKGAIKTRVVVRENSINGNIRDD